LPIFDFKFFWNRRLRRLTQIILKEPKATTYEELGVKKKNSRTRIFIFFPRASCLSKPATASFLEYLLLNRLFIFSARESDFAFLLVIKGNRKIVANHLSGTHRRAAVHAEDRGTAGRRWFIHESGMLPKADPVAKTEHTAEIPPAIQSAAVLISKIHSRLGPDCFASFVSTCPTSPSADFGPPCDVRCRALHHFVPSFHMFP